MTSSLRDGLSGLLNNHSKSILFFCSTHVGSGTPAYCDASRISAGVQFRDSAPVGPNHAKHFQILFTTCSKDPKSSQNSSQTLPNPPKSSQIPPKIDPKSIQKASWSPSWANAWKKLDFERPKNGQEAAKSAQKRPQTGPNPPQMEPKTLPKSNL